MRAHVRAVQKVRARAQVGARTAGHTVLDRDVDGDRLVERAIVARHDIREAAVRAELAALADAAGADEVSLRPHDGVATNLRIGADPGLGGIDEGDALGHEPLVDAVAGDGGELSELHAAIHAQAVAVVLAMGDGHGMAVAFKDLNHVGQVVLGLRVVVADLADVGGKERSIEGIAAGVALEELGVLLGRAVLLLDDAVDGPVLGQLDAAVAKGHGRGEGEHGAGVRTVGDGVGEGGDGIGLDERKVAVQDHHGTGVDARRIQRGADGMRGAQALDLLDALDGVGGRRALVGSGDQRAHLVGVAAHHHDHAGASSGQCRIDDPAGHGLAENLMGHLGMIRLHARALACGHYNRGDIHGDSLMFGIKSDVGRRRP